MEPQQQEIALPELMWVKSCVTSHFLMTSGTEFVVIQMVLYRAFSYANRRVYQASVVDIQTT